MITLPHEDSPPWLMPKAAGATAWVLEVVVKMVEKLREAGTLSPPGSPTLRGVGCPSVVGNRCLLVLGGALEHSLLSFHCYGL